ncbi:hypothetical protein [Paenibacillus lutrae]|uniref:DUF1871 domain-containing protein n=1 Tax=Paenibacillus lutrae TaxID=2078573 RepID=A0A7X3K1N2_9BACL|nr:hypothetical protein [Paenibacillus lutrae]MVP02423.1 hypothetical protein [Paenibacillus lutrae]
MDKNLNEIKEIINEWNPIKIEPLLDDEYTVEVQLINDYLQKHEDITFSDLGEKINDIFDNKFKGYFIKTEESFYIAKKILKTK